MELPLPPVEPVTEVAMEVTPPATRREELKVLVVDDQPLNRLVVESMLPGAEYALRSCASGEAAIRLAEGGAFDVVLMDVHMPGMDRIEALRQLHAAQRRAGVRPTPTVAYTASVTRDEVARYGELGFCDCVAKPVDLHRLVEVLSRAADT